MSLFKSKTVTATVSGVEVEFWSCSFPVLFQLKSAVGPISKLVMGLFKGGRNDVGRYQEDSRNKEGQPIRVTQEMAITPEMVKVRAEQTNKMIQEALDGLFADQNRLLIGKVLMDSMRGIGLPRKPETKEIEAFLQDLDLEQVVEMLQGVAKANAEVFGPLVRAWLKQVSALLHDRVSSVSPISGESNKSSEKSAQPEQEGLRLVPKA
jgi:hypothetical protein